MAYGAGEGGGEGTSVGGSREWNLETPAEQKKAGSSCEVLASGCCVTCRVLATSLLGFSLCQNAREISVGRT